MLKKRDIFSAILLSLSIEVCFAAATPNDVQGDLVFLGVNNTSTRSVWLSLTSAAGSFKLEGPGNQLIDAWSFNQSGSRLSLSPIVSQGNGGTHHLINAANNKKLDSANQSGGIVFPPFPSWQPGIPANPIVLPGTPTHPIVLPGGPTVPIVVPPAQTSSAVSQPSSSENEEGKSLNQKAPITPARQSDEGKKWNIWSDNYYLGIRDGRNVLDTKGGATNFTIGADKHITNKLVGGLSFSAIHLDTRAIFDLLENKVKGFKGGPYFGYQISTIWATDGYIQYGQFQNRNKILSLNSQYITRTVSGTLHAIGLYQFGNFQLRPQPLITYTIFKNPTYNMNGTILNIPVSITRKAENFALGFLELKTEVNYSKKSKYGNLIQPYIELGVDYAFVRPTAGQVFSGNLALASVPKVSGLFTLGIRTVIAERLLIQASGSYLSIGPKDYDVWDARLLISYSFW